MMITSQKATQKSITRPRLSVHHTSFLWASFACQELVLSTTQRLVAPSGAEALPSERSRRSECALVAAGGYSRSRSRDPQMDAGALGQLSQRLCHCIEGLAQQRRIVAVCRSADGAQGGMPFASTAVERLVPRFPLSTGFLPAFSPPPSMPW
jgi:hypothetical protein